MEFEIFHAQKQKLKLVTLVQRNGFFHGQKQNSGWPLSSNVMEYEIFHAQKQKFRLVTLVQRNGFFHARKQNSGWPLWSGNAANIGARCVNVLRKAFSLPRLTQCANSK